MKAPRRTLHITVVALISLWLLFVLFVVLIGCGGGGNSFNATKPPQNLPVQVIEETPALEPLQLLQFPPDRAIIGRDDRRLVNDTTSFPWKAICNLISTWRRDGQTFAARGTGFLVGPRTVITAGHLVHSDTVPAGLNQQLGWANQIEVIPGRNGDQRPFGSAMASAFGTTTAWIENRDRHWDIAVVSLPDDTLAKKINNEFLNLVQYPNPDPQKVRLTTAGYPDDKPIELHGTLWTAFGRIIDTFNPNLLYHEADTASGQSGSPMWISPDARTFDVVAIHVGFTGGRNEAVRFTRGVLEVLREWQRNPP